MIILLQRMRTSIISVLLASLMLSATFNGGNAIRQQAVAVSGRLLCGEAPAKNVRVKLFDEDSGPDPDDELAQGYTGANGEFSLEGSTAELTNIDAVFKPGHRKVRFKIPNSYVSDGQRAKKKFDIGTINLETVFAEEQRELIVSKKKRRHAIHHHRRRLHELSDANNLNLFRQF